MMLKNLIRIGKVSSINYPAGKVRVVFPDKNNIVTSELPLLSFEYYMPAVNDVVICLFLGNGVSQGFCLGKYYNSTVIPRESGSNIYYKDFFSEGFMKYDKNSKTLTFKASNIVVEGDLKVEGNLEVAGSITTNESIFYRGVAGDTDTNYP